jgi:hypothetical protein
VLDEVLKRKVSTVLLDAEEEKKWSRTFKEIFRPR